MDITNLNIENLDHEFLKLMNRAVGHCISENHFATELKPMLEKAIAEKAILSCISIIHLKDMVVKYGINIETLKELGMITNIEDFNLAKETALNKYDEDSRYKVFVKLLKDGLNRLSSSWKQGKMINEALEKELSNEAKKIIANKWSEKRFPDSLNDLIAGELKSTAEQTASDWMNSMIDSDELDTLVENVIFGSIDISEEEDIIKAEVLKNQRNNLMRYFKSGELGKTSIDTVVAQVKEEINDNIVNQIYNHTKPDVVDIIKGLTKGVTASQAELNRIMDKSISRWLKDGLDNALGKEIERLVSKNLQDCKLPYEVLNKVVHEAIRELIYRVKEGELNSPTQNSIQKIMQQIVKDDLMSTTSHAKELHDNLLRSIAGKVLTAWKKNVLSLEQAKTIDCCVNNQLQSWQKEISCRLDMSERINALEQKCESLLSLNRALQLKLEGDGNTNENPPSYSKQSNLFKPVVETTTVKPPESLFPQTPGK